MAGEFIEGLQSVKAADAQDTNNRCHAGGGGPAAGAGLLAETVGRCPEVACMDGAVQKRLESTDITRQAPLILARKSIL